MKKILSFLKKTSNIYFILAIVCLIGTFLTDKFDLEFWSLLILANISKYNNN